MKKINKYRCPSCEREIPSDNTKKWYNSYCTATGKDVRMQLIVKKK